MSCNFLPLGRQVEMAPQSSDTMSEISESGTTLSGWTSKWDSKEDLRDLATKLGLNDVSDLSQERFRVDRKKLEQMLTDPHVRIAGRLEDVNVAKNRILTILNTKCNRVTMKMDVSYRDHSHIIGKAGLSIKRVMQETQCHVHFPDSNRTNPNEKSNQVSISGDIEGVECARSRVRELIPLIFGFELPIMSKNVEPSSAYLLKIQEQYKVEVKFKTRPKLHATLVTVKGVEWEVNQVKQATLLLMEFMCDDLASQIPVQMSMEISPHHYPIVLAKDHSNLKSIMQYTGCKIMIPDAQDPNIPTLTKSHVNITGTIDNVYKARQLLMGSLPLIIIFDLPDDTTDLKIKPEQIAEIQTSCDVIINIRHKANKTTRSCVIKGVERHASKIYAARNLILGNDEPAIQANIPPTYHIPASTAPATIEHTIPSNLNPMPISPLLSPMISPHWHYSPASATGQQGPPFVGMTQQSHFFYNMMQQGMNQQNPPQTISSSGYQSIVTSSSDQGLLDNRPTSSLSSASNLSSISSNAVSSRGTSPSCYRNFSDTAHSTTPNEVSPEMPGECHGLGGDKKFASPNTLSPHDFETRRLAGMRIMQNRPSPGGLRYPNGVWSGYGISHTSPGGVLMDKFRTREDEIWKPNSWRQATGINYPSTSTAMNTSNLLEATPAHVWNKFASNGQWSDLPSMLAAIKLEHYIPVFKEHEIDLTVFLTLTDSDLVAIGITAFGARKRILLAISELNNRNVPFSAAPGAERKSSSSSNSTCHGSPRENW
ncbi:protein bicaudal C isoform X2 [Cylas formicarius]|uniref:protein bicaudal C isoform X2 n=1 Tax=Cylas formicarius TaxID=197179 RepID=UPI002958A032|nr:protein bicaudal C isoform X2 [Cylas formicarius]